jgi:osmotically-inducible protein OsmY
MTYRYLFFSLVLFLTGCTSMVMGGGQQAGIHDRNDDRTLEQVNQDADITQEVRSLLGSNSPVSVSTANGIVTLQGQVASRREIQRIISKVYRVDGVMEVNSQLVANIP